MSTDRYYVVARPGAPYGPPDTRGVYFYDDAEAAVGDYDARTRNGEQVQVYAMEPLPETTRYDWGVLGFGASEPMLYVNERAARSDANHPARTLMRRRLGTREWEPAE